MEVLRSSEFYLAVVAAVLKVLVSYQVLPTEYEPIIVSFASYAIGRVVSKCAKKFIPPAAGGK